MDFSSTLPLLAVLISLLFPSPSFSSISEANTRGIGFSGRLIHRNSIRSPFYNPSLTKSDRIRKAIHNSYSRQRYLQSITNSKGASPHEIQSPVMPQYNEYVLSYYIGTPPTETFAIVDTASDLLWLQCLPCEKCYPQKSPIFDPSKSISFENITCEDDNCSLMPTTRCDTDGKTCFYGVAYQDSSSSEGNLSTETLIFGYDLPADPNITLSNMIFGCGHTNYEPGNADDNAPGVIGLNRNPISFISQLFEESFSYCFVPSYNVDDDSLMHFGSSAVITGGTTPILNVGSGNYYYLNLEGISVDNDTLPIPAGTFNVSAKGEGGFIIDSGTTVTFLNNKAFAMLTDAVEKKMVLEKGEDPTEEFSLCYEGAFSDILTAPDITFHFTGVDVVLDADRAWEDMGTRMYCLAMLPTEGLSIFGNHQQQNLNVGYDLQKKIVSFESTECTIA